MLLTILYRGAYYECAKTIKSRPMWVRRLVYRWDWYEWDAWTRVWTDMTETGNPPLTLIWLRHLGPNLHRYDLDARIQMQEKTLFWASQSYLCKLGPRCLSHISVNGNLNYISLKSRPRASLISVSFGSFCRSHIRHPPISMSHSPGLYLASGVQGVYGPPKRSWRPVNLWLRCVLFQVFDVKSS